MCTFLVGGVRSSFISLNHYERLVLWAAQKRFFLHLGKSCCSVTQGEWHCPFTCANPPGPPLHARTPTMSPANRRSPADRTKAQGSQARIPCPCGDPGKYSERKGPHLDMRLSRLPAPPAPPRPPAETEAAQGQEDLRVRAEGIQKRKREGVGERTLW